MSVVIGPDQAWVLAAPAGEAVRVWSRRRMPFGSDQSADQKDLVALVAPAVRAFALGDGERLHGLFVSADISGRQPDAENVTFYNWKSGDGNGSPFASAPEALSFERSYSPAPTCPYLPDVTFPFFTEWSVRRRGIDDGSWARGETMATFAAACPVVMGDEAGRHVWRAISSDRSRVGVVYADVYAARFGIDVEVSLLPGATFVAAEAVKGCVDGAIASFQRFP